MSYTKCAPYYRLVTFNDSPIAAIKDQEFFFRVTITLSPLRFDTICA